ncbi:MAG: putative Ig domain-containing protein, partial [Desulfuromonadaceae bacterium]
VNASPSIQSSPPATLSSGGYVYQVEATDPDGDAVSYHLEEQPSGMTIEEENGMLTWYPETLSEGVFPVLVVAEDDFGGRAEQRFELNLSFQSKGKE